MTAALVISAGRTDGKKRFSPERKIGRISAIERIVLLLKVAGIQRIVVVSDEEEVPQKLVSSMNLEFLTASSQGEMLDGVKQGLLYLEKKCAQVLVAHADVPMFSRETVEELLGGREEVCIPSFQGRCGHPILLRSSCFQDILSYQGPGGLRGAIEASGVSIQILEVDDEGILTDAQGSLYEALLPCHDISKLRMSFRIRIGREKSFYGPGAHFLLQLTQELGSLSSACQHMGMSYTKGRRIISTMEEQMGVPVLETQQGGKSGGFSRLTREAKQMMRSYSAFQEEAEAALQEIFRKHFPESVP
ncbi:MAG: NTP transferase domain-containing protein [Eubacteriales bacterium]|nr:NTP transferase domain-containing protein [Eubacteriales bacterium]